MSFETIAIRPAELLLPAENVSRETWACVACDQYTSQPKYWHRVEAQVAGNPSTLRLMLPEYNLEQSETQIPAIHDAMKDYLKSGVLVPGVEHGFILIRRSTPSGTRLGLVGVIDLEDYDFTPGSMSLVRPTEQTIASRLPARMAIRRGAALEMSHVLLLIDDPGRTVLEPLASKTESLRKLYDFELMQGGGHLAGWAVDQPEDLAALDRTMNALKESMEKDTMLLAVGDGNHSLATARACWNKIKDTLTMEEQKIHPARYAMVEIENIHDPALLFEPIHRLLTGVDTAEMEKEWKAYAVVRGMCLDNEGEGHSFRWISAEEEMKIVVKNPEGAIPCETIQKFLDDYLSRHPEAAIDYIHGEKSLRMLAKQKNAVGLLLPEIDKYTFFQDVRRLGVLPRKTFSMGEADEKRFYMECRKII